MRSCAKNVVPDSTDGLDTRKYMREPGQYPWNDEDDKIDFAEAFKYLFKLLVFVHKQG